MRKVLLISFLSLLLVTVLYTAIRAKKDGYTGKTSQTSDGCSCHGSTPSSATSLSVISESGSFTVDAGSTTKFTVTINHSLLSSAGVNIAVKTTQTGTTNAGTLEPISGQSLQLISGELTHTNPVSFSDGKVTFSFNWTAPNTPGEYYLRAIGNATNSNNSTSGDQWNWLTPQKITVVKNSSISLSSPNGSESWCAGTTKQITWTSTGINQVKITLSSDGGSTFPTTIANSVEASSGAYNWNLSPSLSPGSQYKIKIEDADDANTNDISNSNFSILEATKITQQPELVSVCAGQPINLSITATGQNLKYQWRKNGTDIPNATQRTFIIQSSTISDAGVYNCAVESDCGKIFSNNAQVTVNSVPSVNSITQDTIICENKPLVLSVVANGSGLSYQWRKNGVNLQNKNLSILSFTNITKSDAGDYDCVVTNSCGESISPKTSIQVVKLPTITKQPQSASVNVGGQVTLNVEADGDDLKYEWTKNGTTIPNQTTNTLTLSNVTKTDAGDYICIVSNNCAEVISSKATLTISDIPVPVLALGLEEYIFPKTLINSKSEAEIKGLIKNVGNADLVINSIEFTGANALSFSLKDLDIPFVIKPQATMDIYVIFNPIVDGDNIAYLKISSNGGNLENFKLVGFAAEVKINFESQSYDFIADNLDKPVVNNINITNSSNTSINISSNIVGNNGDFALLSDNKKELSISEIYNLQIEYKPISMQNSEAELVITVDEFGIEYKIKLIGKYAPNSISDFSNQIMIYPNPFNEKIKIEVPPVLLDKPLSLSLYDNIGNQIIPNKQFDSNTFELNDNKILGQLSKGLYFVMITSGSERILLPLIKY